MFTRITGKTGYQATNFPQGRYTASMAAVDVDIDATIRKQQKLPPWGSQTTTVLEEERHHESGWGGHVGGGRRCGGSIAIVGRDNI